MAQPLEQFAKFPIAVKLVILAVVLVVVAILEWQARYSPLKDELNQVVKQKGDLQLKLVENQTVADNLPTFQEEVNVLNEQLKQAVSLLPNEADIQAILRQLSNLARKTNVELTYFKPGATTSRGFYSEISMELKIDGTYSDIAIYLDQIGKLSRIINVSDLQFTPPRQEGRIMRVGIDCKASTFMFKGGGG